MKTTVFLIRHGAVDNPNKILYGRNIEMQLSEIGKKEIELLAKKIKNLGFKIEKTYSSPLTRAVNSARIIDKVFEIKNYAIEDLTDTNIPASLGLPLRMRTQTYKKEYLDKGNESPQHIIDRMAKTFWRLLNQNEGKTFAVIGHGDPLRFLVYNLSHPNDKKPKISSLKRSKYIYKGTAVKLILENGRLLGRSFINPQNFKSSSIINI